MPLIYAYLSFAAVNSVGRVGVVNFRARLVIISLVKLSVLSPEFPNYLSLYFLQITNDTILPINKKVFSVIAK